MYVPMSVIFMFAFIVLVRSVDTESGDGSILIFIGKALVVLILAPVVVIAGVMLYEKTHFFGDLAAILAVFGVWIGSYLAFDWLDKETTRRGLAIEINFRRWPIVTVSKLTPSGNGPDGHMNNYYS